MLDVSIGCTNPNTYGVSCTFCGKCGRKWTSHGVDDSEVVVRVKERPLPSTKEELWEWLMGPLLKLTEKEDKQMHKIESVSEAINIIDDFFEELCEDTDLYELKYGEEALDAVEFLKNWDVDRHYRENERS